jgi:hypothetical protein
MHLDHGQLGLDMNIVGIDLAGVETRKTGFCIMDENLRVKTLVLRIDKEIVEKTLGAEPRVVAIDAPLSLPKGRRSLDERIDIHLRECDRDMLKMKIKFFPVTLGPMRKLTERGIRIKDSLEEAGLEVIEVYPGGAQDILSIPRKQRGLKKLLSGLRKIGIKRLSEKMGDHELDAVTSALVGKLYIEGNYMALGKPEEGLIIMPKFLNNT